MTLPSYVAASTGVSAVGSGSGSGSFSLSVAYPAGMSVGDRVLLQITAVNQFGSVSVNTPTGFNLLFNDVGTALTGGGIPRQYIFERQITGSEGASVTLSGTWTTGTSGNTGIYGRMYGYTGVRTGSPFTTTGGTNAASSTTASPASLTTVENDSQALLFISACGAASTQANVSGETGGTWAQPIAAFTNTLGPDASIGIQEADLATAGTISGGTATLNPTARWITRTFALLPVLVVEAPFLEDGSNDEVTALWAETAFDQNYTTDVSSINAVRPDLPEDFILGIEFTEFADPPNDTDWNDWSWAQAPPIDDFPEDFLLGIDDGTNLEDPAYTDWFEYGTQTDPLSADIIDFSQIPFVEDASQYDDPSLTDQFDYSTYTDPLSDDAEPPIDVVKNGSDEFDDPSLTDWFEYGTQTDPLSDDIGGDPLPSSIDDGTNLAEYLDEADYSTQTDPTPDDVEEQPIAQVWDGTTEWEEPSLTDFFPYGTEVDPLSANAPPSPLAIGGDDASEYEDPSFTDWMDYGSIVPPPIPPAPPVPPVVPTATPCLRAYENGPPAISACNLNTFGQTCDNLVQLRELIGTPGLQVCVRGAATPGDGGAGIFIWSATQIGGDDGFNIIFPTGGASTGAWVRIANLDTDNRFLPLAGPPDANPNGGYLYVLSNGELHYRGPSSDTALAPP